MSSSPSISNTMSNRLALSNLHPNVSIHMLFDTFTQYGTVLSAQVFKDAATGRSLGSGYVQFLDAAAADKAIDELMFKPYFGTPMRIRWYQPDVSSIGTSNMTKCQDEETTKTSEEPSFPCAEPQAEEMTTTTENPSLPPRSCVWDLLSYLFFYLLLASFFFISFTVLDLYPRSIALTNHAATSNGLAAKDGFWNWNWKPPAMSSSRGRMVAQTHICIRLNAVSVLCYEESVCPNIPIHQVTNFGDDIYQSIRLMWQPPTTQHDAVDLLDQGEYGTLVPAPRIDVPQMPAMNITLPALHPGKCMATIQMSPDFHHGQCMATKMPSLWETGKSGLAEDVGFILILCVVSIYAIG